MWWGLVVVLWWGVGMVGLLGSCGVYTIGRTMGWWMDEKLFGVWVKWLGRGRKTA